MVGMSAFCAFFIFVLFSVELPGCPSWGDGILVTTTGCPNLYKEQKTNVFFYDPQMEARSNGRG
jgi:hypothetical protein